MERTALAIALAFKEFAWVNVMSDISFFIHCSLMITIILDSFRPENKTMTLKYVREAAQTRSPFEVFM